MSEFIERLMMLFPPLLQATPITLILTIVASVLGLVIGFMTALSMLSARRWIAFPAWTYAILFRGTPALVQIYLIYYGMGELLSDPWSSSIRDSWFWPILKEGFWFALLALILNQGAYNAEVLRGAIKSLPKGQIEAAYAFGMKKHTVFRRIILPLTLKRCMPMLISDVIALMKTTALASTITVMDILGTARLLQRQTALVYEPLIAAAIIYLLIVFVITKSLGIMEKRMSAYQIG